MGNITRFNHDLHSGFSGGKLKFDGLSQLCEFLDENCRFIFINDYVGYTFPRDRIAKASSQ
ncbi:hypothetical protein D3C73_1647980 [compost metagenome]